MTGGMRPNEHIRIMGRWPLRGGYLGAVVDEINKQNRRPPSGPSYVLNVAWLMRRMADVDGVVVVYLSTPTTPTGVHVVRVVSTGPAVVPPDQLREIAAGVESRRGVRIEHYEVSADDARVVAAGHMLDNVGDL